MSQEVLPVADLEARKIRHLESVAECRSARWESSRAFKQVLWESLVPHVMSDSSVLHVGCGGGDLLRMLRAKVAVGIEPSADLAALARRRHPEIRVLEQPVESFRVETRFDYILADDVLIDCFDVDELLDSIHRAADESSRVILINYSQAWRPILKVLRWLGLARPRFGNTWFSPLDLEEALARRGFELVSEFPAILLPLRIPLLSGFCNRFLAKLPFFRAFCLLRTFIARKGVTRPVRPQSVSVIVPARNEAGNVARLMREIPAMGSWAEVIFVEGNSKDDTWDRLQAVIRERNDPRVRLIKQPGKGKGDAVRAGFAEAKGEILMILDADLTVPAESLPKFYEVVASGHADFANGTRLVYQMDGRAMQFLNLLANHFFARAFTYVLGQPVRDTLCGTKVLSRGLYAQIAAHRSYFGDFDPFGDFDLLFGAARLHAKIVDVPIRYRERVYGETNISRFRHGLMLFRMLALAAAKLKFQ